MIISSLLDGFWCSFGWLFPSGQRPHADLFEPYNVARIMVLKADITHLWTFRFAFRLVPYFPRRHVVIFRIEIGGPLAVQIDGNSGACQRNDHGFPFARRFFGSGGGRSERVNRPGAMQGITASACDLDFVTAMDREPCALFAFSRSFHFGHRFVGRFAFGVPLEFDARLLELIETCLISPNL